MSIPTNRLLLNREFKTLSDNIALHICDVGAREELFKPFNDIPEDLLHVIGFEPDAEEAIRLGKKFEGRRKYFPYGLWESSTEIELSYAKLAGNSSIHPPNLETLKSLFPPINWETRIPKEILKLPVKSLDDVCREESFDLDLLKVDTQGSEMEILKGAKAVLDFTSFVLLETWTFEVHKGQALSGEIMEWMHKQGFTLVRINKGAEWYRKTGLELTRKGLPSLIGLDLLFVRNNFEQFSTSKTIRAAALAELYGFPDLALQILDSKRNDANSKKARATILNNWKQTNDPLYFRVIRKIASSFGWELSIRGKSEFAPLH
jgi:FkbM family methyltransferase